MAKRRGTTGNDVLTGTNGADVITGLAGDDLIDPLLGADRIDGGAGNDIVRFSSVMSSWPPPSEVGMIDGGGGYDTIDLRAIAPTAIGGNAGQLTVSVGSQAYTLSGVEQILLGAGDSASYLPLFYTGSDVAIRAGDGGDYFQGSGNFELYGEGGNDSFWIAGVFGTNTTGVIDGGEGYDTLALFNAMTLDLSAGMLQSGGATYAVAGIEAVTAFSDSVVIGSDRDDVFAVRPLFDYDYAGVHYDGRGGSDLLSGSQGRDAIDGGSGDDVIRGSGNVDVLTGGTGTDRFVFDADDSVAADPDTITDFSVGEDRIDLSEFDADPSTPGLDRLHFIGQHAFDGVVGEVRFARQGRDTIVQIDLDGDRQADQAILLSGRVALKPASFIFKPEVAADPLHALGGHAHDAPAASVHLGFATDLP